MRKVENPNERCDTLSSFRNLVVPLLTTAIMIRFASIIGFVLMLVSLAGAAEWNVHGRVVDEAGKPVADATIASFWLGSGKRLHGDGTPLGFGKQDDTPAYWQHIGEMEPVDAEHSATTDRAGQFTFALQHNKHALMVMDRTRKHGALASVRTGNEAQSLEIRWGPLVRVRGTFAAADIGAPPHWGVADVSLPDDPDR